jgi:hypothetical protein
MRVLEVEQDGDALNRRHQLTALELAGRARKAPPIPEDDGE